MSKKQYPDVDINLLEFAVGSYLYYNKMGLEQTLESMEQFQKSKEVIKSLIEETKAVAIEA